MAAASDDAIAIKQLGLDVFRHAMDSLVPKINNIDTAIAHYRTEFKDPVIVLNKRGNEPVTVMSSDTLYERFEKNDHVEIDGMLLHKAHFTQLVKEIRANQSVGIVYYDVNYCYMTVSARGSN